jgi:TRAP transporter TAXI family solute receptor
MFRRVLTLLAMMALVAGGPAAAQQRTFIAIATGGTAGVYFPLGAALAEIWSSRVAGIQATAQATAASVANLSLLARGDVQVALVQNDIAFYAAEGIEMFGDPTNRGRPLANVRGVAMLYPETVQIVTLRGKGISSVADLQDKRVAVGPAGSGTEVNARQVLRMYDLDYANIREELLNFAEAADQLKDGVIDAAFITAGVPTAAVEEIASAQSLMLVPIPPDVVDRLRERWPYYTPVTIPAGAYRGQEGPVDTAAVMAMLVVRAELSEDLVYNLTKKMWENIKILQAAHPRGKDIAITTARRGMPIGMHVGALRYYRERGVR